MAVWLRRLVYLLLALLWLLVISLPLIAVILATQGEIQLGSQQSGQYVRLFLIQESEQEGVGLEWSRAASADACQQGSTVYLMWEGAGENARYCTCFDENGSVISSIPGPCPAG